MKKGNLKPKVTVLIPIYNENILFLKESLKSLISQTFKLWECILVFEGSNKENLFFLKDICKIDNRFTLVESDSVLGLVKSLNLGLSLAKSKYIARFDSDDKMKPNRLLTQYNFLEKNPAITVVGSNIIKINNSGKSVGLRKYPESGESLLRYFSFRCGLAHPTVMYRLSDIKAVGMYNENLSKGEDLDLWLRLLRSGYKFFNIQIPLLEYRLNNLRDQTHWREVLKIRKSYRGLFGKNRERFIIIFFNIYLLLKKFFR